MRQYLNIFEQIYLNKHYNILKNIEEIYTIYLSNVKISKQKRFKFQIKEMQILLQESRFSRICCRTI